MVRASSSTNASFNSHEDFQYYEHEPLQMGRILVRPISTVLRALTITTLQNNDKLSLQALRLSPQTTQGLTTSTFGNSTFTLKLPIVSELIICPRQVSSNG